MYNMSIKSRDGTIYNLVPITGKKLDFIDYYKKTLDINPGKEKEQIQGLCMSLHENFDLCDPKSYNYHINLSVLGEEQVPRDLIFAIAINAKLNLKCINNPK